MYIQFYIKDIIVISSSIILKIRTENQLIEVKNYVINRDHLSRDPRTTWFSHLVRGPTGPNPSEIFKFLLVLVRSCPSLGLLGPGPIRSVRGQPVLVRASLHLSVIILSVIILSVINFPKKS